MTAQDVKELLQSRQRSEAEQFLNTFVGPLETKTQQESLEYHRGFNEALVLLALVDLGDKAQKMANLLMFHVKPSSKPGGSSWI